MSLRVRMAIAALVVALGIAVVAMQAAHAVAAHPLATGGTIIVEN